MGSELPIGVFDSGVGGLSVLRHIMRQLPSENVIYLADQANLPYGSKSAATIRTLTEQITKYLLAQECKLIVVACNTATAAAIEHLRLMYPEILFVGMEPAVKPAVAATQTGHVGILATASTFESQKYALLTAQYASDVIVYEDACLGLVELIEEGDSRGVKTLLTGVIKPMLASGVDTLVLGCTHYPLVRHYIKKIARKATIIDPAPAIARQTHRLLVENDLLATDGGRVDILTTGSSSELAHQLRYLLEWYLPVSHVQLVKNYNRSMSPALD